MSQETLTVFEQQANYFKALAHPVRLQILEVLRQGEACVCHMEALMGRRQAYISQQLGVLKRAGLLVERKEGLFIFYSLADAATAAVLDSSRRSTQAQADAPLALDLFEAAAATGCACPACATTSQ